MLCFSFNKSLHETTLELVMLAICKLQLLFVTSAYTKCDHLSKNLSKNNFVLESMKNKEINNFERSYCVVYVYIASYTQTTEPS